ELRAQCPVHRLSFPDGTEGWLVNGHSVVREVLADARFSARHELRGVPADQRDRVERAAPGFFVRMDPPEHTKYRRLLTGQFTVRRMNLLVPRIEEITEECLDAMRRKGPPVDLVGSFAVPIPSLVICELLGVPRADRARFQSHAATAFNLEATGGQVSGALTGINQFLGELVRRKRIEPADDLLSGLLASGELTDGEATAMAFLLLVAGHETTSNMLALGVYALLCHQDQLALLRAEPTRADAAVEELLRYLSIIQFGAMRVALEDVELHGHVVRAGEALVLSLPAANRDPERFTDPDTLDLTRSAAGHLAFGHGVHQCLGQQLARVQMRIGYTMLLRRFPRLRLAIPPEDVPLRHAMATYGVHRLPVTWKDTDDE
ncbi:MAG: cytochrome P450, partial [Kutzneria sp.]|nr:cytochrome P450 [Kutzneria sp.]